MLREILAVAAFVALGCANPIANYDGYFRSYDPYAADFNPERDVASAATGYNGNEVSYFVHHYNQPTYNFEYGVDDSYTGDKKSQYEERVGDVVRGHYSVVQPDGVTRTVKYTADHRNGFIADVYLDGKLVSRG